MNEANRSSGSGCAAGAATSSGGGWWGWLFGNEPGLRTKLTENLANGGFEKPAYDPGSRALDSLIGEAETRKEQAGNLMSSPDFLNFPGGITEQQLMSGAGAVAMVGISMIPFVGEAMDAYTVLTTRSSVDRSLAAASLAGSLYTGGLTPNYSAISRLGSEGGQALARNGDQLGSGVRFIDDAPNMSQAARNYEDAATGARSSLATKRSQVPVLDRTLPDGSKATVKFDGIDGNVLIDRKTRVTTFPKSKDQALRQSHALRENGYTGRWEVPNSAEATRARKMLEDLGITNIGVQVVP